MLAVRRIHSTAGRLAERRIHDDGRSSVSRDEEVIDLATVREAGVQASWAGGRNSEAEGKITLPRSTMNRCLPT